MWIFGWAGPFGFSGKSTAEQVTQGIDGTGLTAIVTGTSNGIGIETARALALRGVHIVMGVRNVNAGNKVKEQILAEAPDAKIDVIEIDLNSLASQFAVNHLGPFHLTNLLLETMKTTARESNKEGRIVNLSSVLHKSGYKEGIRFDNINEESSYDGNDAYGQSKLCNLLHTNELARRLKADGVNITANSLHHGLIATNITNNLNIVGWLFFTIGQFFLKNVAQGATTTCYVALHPQVKGVSGEYFIDSNKADPSATSAMSKDPELAKKLWDFSLNLTAGK
ncbi:short-chain dehydrogenase TIC 32, chloroplastic-like [Heracleum sosnowskyi]|uniref:Short-chain dehydrogenase TIC 32, chloroplastic-like n=1 Tax=Heracleum sosnowskyi TaxID=360622 RepID=A0AAD8HT97_9APIA|nr:short-chain dehydrogenase TIC 32, chloroplastic-like [Heracleum sosnowskyi]